MAQCVGNLAKSTFQLLGNNLFKQLMFNASRQLYSPTSMGMNGYLNTREHVKIQFQKIDHLFYDKMKLFVDNNDNLIFTEDLKTMLHLIEKKPEHMDLMCKMLKKYNTQNDLRFGTFTFGTVVMRALFHLDEPDYALKLFFDPELKGFFDQMMSYQLLMTLLYNHGRYDDVKAVCDFTKDKNIYGVIYPRNPFIIVMAACYQQNTKESFDYAMQLFKQLKEKSYEFPRRAITFMGALALKQNKPDMALEVITLAKHVSYIDIRNIKLLAFIQLNRAEEVIVQLRESLQTNVDRRKQCFFTDAIECVENFAKNEQTENSDELRKLVNQLRLHDFIQTGTLHEHLLSVIESIKFMGKPWQKEGSEQREYPKRMHKSAFH